jgi:hypothetical protein
MRPTDDAIVLAMKMTGREWLYGDQVRHVLKRFGFEMSPQWVTAQLRRLLAEEGAMIETRERFEWAREYRVTPFGDCQLGNNFDGFARYARSR